MVAIPDWLKPNGFVFHPATNTIFHAVKAYELASVSCPGFREQTEIILKDAIDGKEYPLYECEQLTIEHFGKERSYSLGNKKLTVSPHEDGCIISGKRLRKLIKWRNIDPVHEAAKSLAEFFDGVIVPDETKVHPQYADDPDEPGEEVPPNDW